MTRVEGWDHPRSMKSFTGKVAVVTGAASGIGRALSDALALEGCHLALADLNEPGLEAAARQARSRGVTVTATKLDVANREAVFAWADEVAREHGPANLVINNAGVALVATVDELAYEDFEWLMGINFWGVVHGTKAFLPQLQANGEGHIVNISSVFGMIGVPAQAAYNSAKFAVRGFTEALRQELDMVPTGVSASVVHPGGIATDIARSARMSPRFERKREKRLRDFDRTARTSPEDAARIILDGVRANKPRILVGADAHMIDAAQRVSPTGYQRITRFLADRIRRRL